MGWLEEIDQFESLSEYIRFRTYLVQRIAERELEEIEPLAYFFGPSPAKTDQERWFRDRSSDELWRLVPPDFPYQGFFRKVSE